ncbi:MAG: hypothetical protein HQ582_00745 [Planctomycetes bacterium]|nr:hypothetical protein [Planctomycetota bacterium]
MFNIVVVTAFTGAVVAAIWLFYNGYPWLVSISTLLIIMIAAFVAGDTGRERIVVSLSVPFFALGGYIGFQVFFAMFRFLWFEAIFNGKGGGPAGLIVFVVGFALATASVAACCIDRLLFLVLWLVGALPTNAEQSEEPERTGG